MKTLLLLFCLSTFSISFSQHDLASTYFVRYGQVWGFLKYFHPAPSAQDWDQRLLDDFDKLQTCRNTEAFNVLVTSLIQDCGEFTALKRSVPDSLKYSECYEWIHYEGFTEENRSALLYLLEHKPEFKNHYILKNAAGNPKIINEREFQYETYNPAINYLALTRYWNIINYYCPNRNLIPYNWTAIYTQYVPVFLEAKDYDAYYFAVRQLTTRIRDGHGFIRCITDPMSAHKFAPFYFNYVEEGYFVTTVWKDSMQSFDVQRNDRIVAFDGIPVEEKVKELASYVASSNDYFLAHSTHYLRLFPGDSLRVTLERDGKLLERTVPTIDRETLRTRYKAPQPKENPKPYRLLTDSLSGKSYVYVDMALLKRADIDFQFKRALRKSDHLIIDSRNYPNWTVIKLCKVLIHGKTKFATFRAMNFDYPGSYEWTQSQTIGGHGKAYPGKIYVLVDYNTMSQAEYTVMGFQQHPNTVVIGGQTAGADGNITPIPLPYSIHSVYSGLAVYYPDGTCAQQVGVKRDYPFVQDVRYITEGRDAILEKALELLRKE